MTSSFTKIIFCVLVASCSVTTTSHKGKKKEAPAPKSAQPEHTAITATSLSIPTPTEHVVPDALEVRVDGVSEQQAIAPTTKTPPQSPVRTTALPPSAKSSRRFTATDKEHASDSDGELIDDPGQLTLPTPQPHQGVLAKLLQVPRIWYSNGKQDPVLFQQLKALAGIATTAEILLTQIDNGLFHPFLEALNVDTAGQGDSWLNEAHLGLIKDKKASDLRRLWGESISYRRKLPAATLTAIDDFLLKEAEFDRQQQIEAMQDFARNQRALARLALHAQRSRPTSPELTDETTRMISETATDSVVRTATGGLLPPPPKKSA